MKINFDRICRLAGVESRQERKRRLTEGAGHGHSHDDAKNEKHGMYHEEDEGMKHMEEMDYSEGVYHEEDEGMKHMEEMEEYGEGSELEEFSDGAMYEEDEAIHHEEDEKIDRLDEMVEVDPKILMEEIRRAKKLRALRENRSNKKQQLQENHLKRVIRSEIQNILKEMDNSEENDSEWLYGNNKPRNSKKGYTSQGRLMPGIGFKKSW